MVIKFLVSYNATQHKIYVCLRSKVPFYCCHLKWFWHIHANSLHLVMPVNTLDANGQLCLPKLVHWFQRSAPHGHKREHMAIMTTVNLILDIHLDYDIKKRKQRSITLISNEMWYIDVYPILKLAFYFVLLHFMSIVLTIFKRKLPLFTNFKICQSRLETAETRNLYV